MPVRSLLILVCVTISASATHLWLAATLLLLPRAGTFTQTCSASLAVFNTVLRLGKQIGSETLFGMYRVF